MKWILDYRLFELNGRLITSPHLPDFRLYLPDDRTDQPLASTLLAVYQQGYKAGQTNRWGPFGITGDKSEA